MTRMEEENIKLRALLEQVKQDLEPALAILSEDKGVIGLDSRLVCRTSLCAMFLNRGVT